MANKKMTKAQAWKIVREIVEKSGHEKAVELVGKIDNELELLAKKNSADRKPTKTQEANAVLKVAIVEGMEPNRLYTVSELMKVIPALAEDENITNQKVSALLRQLVLEGVVKRTEDKRKAYFSLA